MGRGSSGRVRLAKHTVTGQLAAVKIVPKSIITGNSSSAAAGNTSTQAPDTPADSQTQNGNDDDSKDRAPYGIEREVIIMKLIEHPNVMALYDVWENKGEL